MLEVSIHKKSYGNKVILEEAELHIAEQGLYGVVGKNGAGKTSLFACMLGLTDFKGQVLYNGTPLRAEQVGFIPTEPYLYEHLTVGEFYRFYAALMQLKLRDSYLFEIDKELLIKELSTGMRRKVYLNVVLQKESDLYIFDEPFNGLDIETVYTLRRLIKNLAEEHIVLMASHLLESLQSCKTIFVVKDRKVTAVAPPDYNTIETILFQD